MASPTNIAASFVRVFGVSMRTLGVDMVLLNTIRAVDRLCPDCGGELVVHPDHGQRLAVGKGMRCE